MVIPDLPIANQISPLNQLQHQCAIYYCTGEMEGRSYSLTSSTETESGKKGCYGNNTNEHSDTSRNQLQNNNNELGLLENYHNAVMTTRSHGHAGP